MNPIIKVGLIDLAVRDLISRSARLEDEKYEVLSQSSHNNRQFIENGYARSQQAIADLIAEIENSAEAWQQCFSKVELGALLRIVMTMTNGQKKPEWWFIVSDRFASQIPILRFAGIVVLTKTTYLFGAPFRGSGAGCVMRMPPVHGDSRDDVDSILIAEIF